MAGLLITMEGVEGCGKTTQIRLLAQRLGDLGVPVAVSMEPGGTALGREIRALLLEPRPSGETWAPVAELLLFYADRAQHLATFVRPMLEAGKVVLLDRFDDSTRAYQGARGIPDGVLDRVGEVVLGRLKPTMTVVLDVDPADAMPRVRARNGSQEGFRETRFDDESLEFHRRVRNRFLGIAQREPQRVVVVPAHEPADKVAELVWSRVAPLMRTAGYRVE